MRGVRPGAILLLLLALAACTGEPPAGRVDRDTLSRRQRDSIIGASSLPGARAIVRALESSDASAARARALDSLMQ